MAIIIIKPETKMHFYFSYNIFTIEGFTLVLWTYRVELGSVQGWFVE